MSKPVCFIIMSYGKKSYTPKNSKDGTTREMDYDVIYDELIVPAVTDADMEPVRADKEAIGGIIHKPMFERILLSEYVLADLTGLNANVFYELGMRHAYRPYTTVNIYAKNSILPFDTNALRTLPYDPENPEGDKIKATITKFLLDAKNDKMVDSPVFQLVNGLRFQNSVAHEKTDIFREQIDYNKNIAQKLSDARALPEDKCLAAIDMIVKQLKLMNEETGVLIDVMLSYRAVGAWKEMVKFIEDMPAHIQHTIMVQEQYALALNRIDRRQQAKSVLNDLIKQHPPSSETYGILGRVHKDEFELALKEKNELGAQSALDKAIETYRKGFEADWRDFYPGVNLVTLLEISGQKDEVHKIMPVVEFSTLQKLKRKDKSADYWDYVTLVELEVIKQNQEQAKSYLIKALSCNIEHAWMFDTTIKNIQLLEKFRLKRNESVVTEGYIIGLLQVQKSIFEENAKKIAMA
jgi:tetratricopeptide (TPR) repeat protein